MKVLVTGVGGQLGYDVMNELAKRGHIGIGTDLPERSRLSLFDETDPIAEMPYYPLDITDADAVSSLISALSPDAVVHCAAWTAVDAAEDPNNRETVYAVNVTGTRNIALACKKSDCKMVYISTDYVFNGRGELPWEADCKDFAPLNVYGQTKLEGEQAVAECLNRYFIVRIAWVFGANGNNFVKTMLRIGKKNDTLRVVNDQIGTPTYTPDLARLLIDLLESEKYGCYHATNEGGYLSWYEFACEIFKQAGYSTAVLPVTTEEYGISQALRPFNSRLSKQKLIENGFQPLADWRDALARYLQTIRMSND